MTEAQEQKTLRRIMLGVLISSLGMWFIPVIPIWGKIVITVLGSTIAFIGFLLSLITIQ